MRITELFNIQSIVLDSAAADQAQILTNWWSCRPPTAT